MPYDNYSDRQTPNGSVKNIAGIRNPDGNVMGDSECASLPILTPNNKPEGRLLFDSMMNYIATRANDQ